MKIKVISCYSPEHLEREVHWWIEQFQKEGQEVVDVQYGGCGGLRSGYDGGYYEYSAMIIYK